MNIHELIDDITASETDTPDRWTERDTAAVIAALGIASGLGLLLLIVFRHAIGY